MDGEDRPSLTAVVAGTGLLLARGYLLWAVVPAGLMLWVIVVLMAPRDLSPGQVIGWLDLNLIALLQRTMFRPLFREPVAWVSWTGIYDVTQQVRPLDLA